MLYGKAPVGRYSAEQTPKGIDAPSMMLGLRAAEGRGAGRDIGCTTPVEIETALIDQVHVLVDELDLVVRIWR